MEFLRFIEGGRITPQEQMDDYSCGACAMRHTLEYFGEVWSQEYLKKALETTQDGTRIEDIKSFLWYKGYSTEEMAGISYERLQKLRKDVPEPIWVVLQEGKDSHYTLIKEVRDQEIDLFDTGNGSIETVPKQTFVQKWRSGNNLKDADVHWCLVVKKI